MSTPPRDMWIQRRVLLKHGLGGDLYLEAPQDQALAKENLDIQETPCMSVTKTEME